MKYLKKRKIGGCMSANEDSCEMCGYYQYDEDEDCYYCSMSLDEDERYDFMSGNVKRCPYFQYNDEYKIVRKQM